MKFLLSVFDFFHDSTLKLIAWLLVLSSITGGILLPQPFYFSAVGLLGIMLLFKERVCFSNLFVLLLLFVCMLSLIFNQPPAYFRAWSRLGAYSLILLVISPMLFSERALILRFKLLFYFLYLSIILSVGSFFAYFLNINLFERQGEILEIGAGTFSGLMNHSMVLGPISALSAILLFSLLIIPKGIKKKPLKTIGLIAMLLFCCGACLLAASRIALVGLVVGILVTILMAYRKRLSKAFGIVFLILFIGGITYPVWGKLTTFILQKQEGNVDRGSVIYSREEKFSARLYEFKSSPIIGIGFCVADPRFTGVNKSNGRVEPGSSWLAIASMTGILGLMVFLPLCIIAAIKVWRIRDPLVSSILSGMLFFFFVHMIAEGYIYAPKSYLSLLFWLIVSSIYGISIVEKKGKVFKINLK